MAKKILVLLGPNMNMVGVREKGVYGDETAESINQQIWETAKKYGFICDIFQSNWEGAIIDKIHEAKGKYDGAVINAGAFTHYSYAIHDAIAVSYTHLDVYKRQEKKRGAILLPASKPLPVSPKNAGNGKSNAQKALLSGTY